MKRFALAAAVAAVAGTMFATPATAESGHVGNLTWSNGTCDVHYRMINYTLFGRATLSDDGQLWMVCNGLTNASPGTQTYTLAGDAVITITVYANGYMVARATGDTTP